MSKTVAQKFFKRVAKKMEKLGQPFDTGTHSGTVCHKYDDRGLLQSVGLKAAKKMNQKWGVDYRTDSAGDVYVGNTLLVCGRTLYQI